jgi:hypothetical protein
MNARNALYVAKAIRADIGRLLGPPEEGQLSSAQNVILMSMVRGTRGYIERVANQVNGTYENGWYDACAVMLRRLLETLIIEVFEHYKVDSKIKNAAGDFLLLKDLIDRCLREPTWNLSRNCKQAMPKLKDVGDKSAHSRRYNAHRGDIEPLVSDIRLVVQELVYLAGLK